MLKLGGFCIYIVINEKVKTRPDCLSESQAVGSKSGLQVHHKYTHCEAGGKSLHLQDITSNQRSQAHEDGKLILFFK